ncbi:hypothetical protein FOZ60_011577 [Perkinsus olseni]|uniref:Uncharacterized protein n=1 Tax=Perkinsus olseni TaxID=32597 RepID=A0A7J6NFI0_PEROL|nr:hypothetical protein FOZ60_011577 [Perkinsus olseni]
MALFSAKNGGVGLSSPMMDHMLALDALVEEDSRILEVIGGSSASAITPFPTTTPSVPPGLGGPVKGPGVIDRSVPEGVVRNTVKLLAVVLLPAVVLSSSPEKRLVRKRRREDASADERKWYFAFFAERLGEMVEKAFAEQEGEEDEKTPPERLKGSLSERPGTAAGVPQVKAIDDATGGAIVEHKDEEKEDFFEGVKGSLSGGRGISYGAEFLGKMVDDAIEKEFAEGDDEGETAPEQKLNLLQTLFKEDSLIEAGVLGSGLYVADIRANSGKVGILVVDLSASLSAPRVELRYQAERCAPDWSGGLLLSPFYSPRGKKSFERSGMALDGRNFTHSTMFIGKDTLERRDDDGKLYIDFARKGGVHSDYYRIVLEASRRK